LLIGLTVVAFGTSAPELVVAARAALEHRSGLVVGNVIGSNIMNIAVVVGLSAAAHPIMVAASTVRRETLIALAAVGVAYLAGLDGQADRIEGVLLLIGFTLFGAYCWRLGRRGEAPVQQPDLAGPWNRVLIAIPAAIAGLVGLSFGAQFLVEGASKIALELGVKETVVGLTVVAIGTSLPELVTSVVAVLRGQPDIGVGNVLGSNVFNALLVLGTASAISPMEFCNRSRLIDGPLMIALSIALVVMTATGRRISRLEGAALLAVYAGYLALLVALPGLGG
jgi:cation:H+ antiporter